MAANEAVPEPQQVSGQRRRLSGLDDEAAQPRKKRKLNSGSVYISQRKKSALSSPDKAMRSAEKQVQAYLDDDFEDDDDADGTYENPLVYWSKQGGNRGYLREVALQILTMPAVSAAVERLFSLSGNIQTWRRMRLTAKHVGDTCKLKKRKRGVQGGINFEDIYDLGQSDEEEEEEQEANQ